MSDFAASLSLGRLGEAIVVAWLQRTGWGVIPSYDFTGSDGSKAPRLLFESRGLVVPDVDCCRAGVRRWVEVKTYHHAHPNRILGDRVHGFPGRLLDSYLAVERESGTPVWLFVLEVQTGDLMAARLASLRAHPCQCGPCRGNRPDACGAPLRRGVYFKRSELSRVHSFADDELVGLRTAWPTPRSWSAA